MIPRWHLRSIFGRVPEQLLKDLVSWGSPGECSMIYRFLGDAFGGLSCLCWSTVLQCSARLQIHTLNYGARFFSQWCPFFDCGCVRVLTLVIVDLFQQYYVCCISSGETLCTIFIAFYLYRICSSASYMRCFGRTSVYSSASCICRTSQYHMTFIPLSVPFWNDLSYPVFDSVRLAGFKSRANALLLA